MSCEGTPVKAPPGSRRKMMPPTPRQSLQSSIEATQWQAEVKDQEGGSYEKALECQHRWNALDRTVIVRMELYPNESRSMKVQIEELESLPGPEELAVNLRLIFQGREQKGQDLRNLQLEGSE